MPHPARSRPDLPVGISLPDRGPSAKLREGLAR